MRPATATETAYCAALKTIFTGGARCRASATADVAAYRSIAGSGP
jgi:hypothetical protein